MRESDRPRARVLADGVVMFAHDAMLWTAHKGALPGQGHVEGAPVVHSCGVHTLLPVF